MASETRAPEDALLVQRLKARDEAALEALMSQYGGKIFGLAQRLTGNRADAEEVLQDVFWGILRNIASFREDAKLSTWIYRITTNTTLMKLRQRPKGEQLPLEEALGPAMTADGMIAERVVDWTTLPSEKLERKELARRLEGATDQLPPGYRTVLVLRDIEGLSAAEACEMLNLSVPALKSRLHRARLFLRKQLADYIGGRPPAITPADPGGCDGHMS